MNRRTVFVLWIVGYCVLAAVVLFGLRFAVFALFVNARSWAAYIIGILVLAFIVSAAFVGISHVQKPRVLKLTYFSLATVVLALIGLSYFFTA